MLGIAPPLPCTSGSDDDWQRWAEEQAADLADDQTSDSEQTQAATQDFTAR